MGRRRAAANRYGWDELRIWGNARADGGSAVDKSSRGSIPLAGRCARGEPGRILSLIPYPYGQALTGIRALDGQPIGSGFGEIETRTTGAEALRQST
jgi:hypothetical protein